MHTVIRKLRIINFGHVSDVSIDRADIPNDLTITVDIMKNLKTICVENLDLSENRIVDYEPGSLFSFDHPECLRHISFKGNRFLLFSEKSINETKYFVSKTVRLKSLDYSYNAVNYGIKYSGTSNSDLNCSFHSCVILPESLEKIFTLNCVNKDRYRYNCVVIDFRNLFSESI